MKVTAIRAYQVACDMPEPLGNALQVLRRRAAVLVQVVTDQGVSGWGENASSPVAAGAYIRKVLAPLLLGRDPRATLPLHRAMLGTLNYDRRGVSLMATSALDMALWDARAKIEGVPLHAMLGGAVRERATAYVSGPFMRPGEDPYARVPEEAEAHRKEGFRALKLRSGLSPRADAAIVATLRRQLGDEVALMIDVNRGYTPRAALEAADRMQEAGLLWIEEPLAPDDLPGYRMLSGLMRTAIAGGEALAGLPAFRDALIERTFDILQPDLSVCGGFTSAMGIAALGEAFGIPVMAHVFGTVVNFHASLQMTAVLPSHRAGDPWTYPFFEYDRTPNALRRLRGDHPVAPDGTVAIPDAPGIGVDLDPAELEPYLQEYWEEAV
ncbi:mandelate racemase/muconate lactonizing enzyme family protein [Pararoseomonas indoligenes]|uniref:Mandelate racemase/muconate lactonizing enzyme family protein n=1 Tax=Roseomonas indoligenes TaxID=2820811 RepID=A0A940MT17_9PROT|nr:mandelate racemase/muconate lactonizing enzyme family protein [Pararoseomonas indoligenes]MBP0491376.1 mandelate racemase/muconate lactonizing enzyme family protein [Pararoseomonas indoligenes]